MALRAYVSVARIAPDRTRKRLRAHVKVSHTAVTYPFSLDATVHTAPSPTTAAVTLYTGSHGGPAGRCRHCLAAAGPACRLCLRPAELQP
jgi:hypothetical protein